MNDAELLRRFLRDGSQEAFAGLVTEHTDLVFSSAMRRLGNQTAAEDVTQAVFVILAQKAATMNPDKVNLPGWFYNTTRYASLAYLRDERLRKKREREAGMAGTEQSVESVWSAAAPLLEEGLDRLGQGERELLLAKFFKNRNYGEISSGLGITETVARKKVSRAVEKLRSFFRRKGVVVPAALLAATLSANTVLAAPAGLAGSVTAAAVAKGGVVLAPKIGLIAKGAIKMMMWAKLKMAAACLVAVTVSGAALPTVVHVIAGENKPAKTAAAEAKMLYPIEQNGKWGYIDETGKVVVKPMFEDATEMKEDMALVKQNGKYGFIHVSLDKEKNIKPQFDYARSFSDGLACVNIGGEWKNTERERNIFAGKYGFVDKSGKIVINMKFDYVGDFSDNYAVFAIITAPNFYKYGYIDKTGKIVIEPIYDRAYGFADGLAIVKKEDRVSIIDKSGKAAYVFPENLYINDLAVNSWLQNRFSAKSFNSGYALLSATNPKTKSDKVHFLVNNQGRVVLDLSIYEYLGAFSDGLVQAKGIKGKITDIIKDGKVIGKQQEGSSDPYTIWYFGTDGKIAMEDRSKKYREAFEFHSGLARVIRYPKKNEMYASGRYGYIDQNGNEVIPCVFDMAGDFTADLASVRFKKYGFIAPDGKICIAPVYDAVLEFSEGLAPVKNNGKWGYIDQGEKVVINFEFDMALGFSEGLAPVKIGDQWGYVDKEGKMAIAPQYSHAWGFSEGLAAVQASANDRKCDYIDKKGNIVIPQAFTVHSAGAGFSFKRSIGERNYSQNSKKCIIDETGKVVLDNVDCLSHRFSEGLVLARKDKKIGFIDTDGKTVIDYQFDDVAFYDVKEFREGLAAVRKEGKWGFINKVGDFVIEPSYNAVKSFSEGLAGIEQNGKWGYIDKAGKIIIKPQYAKVNEFNEGFAIVAEDPGAHSVRIIDKNNETRHLFTSEADISLERDGGLLYTQIKNGAMRITLNGRAYINKKGEFVWSNTEQRPTAEPEDGEKKAEDIF
jgi:RNA polymerase sigma factor (sigma-70 family)